MVESNEKYLEIFPQWLRNLGNDVLLSADALENASLGTDAKKRLAGGINYLFKSLDLIPDGIDDIGYLDDAFILRISAGLCLDSENGDAGDLSEKLKLLKNDVAVIEEFLGNDIFKRLETYTDNLKNGAARGRTVDEICSNDDILAEFIAEAKAFAEDYSSPGFTKDEKSLIKLKAFLDAKLPK